MFSFFLVIIITIAGLAVPVYSQNININHSGFMRVADNGANISKSQAGRLAQRKYGGKVLKITTVNSDRGTIYHVRLLLDSGKVINVTVDGQTGQVG